LLEEAAATAQAQVVKPIPLAEEVLEAIGLAYWRTVLEAVILQRLC
jgi:hypothetical protein